MNFAEFTFNIEGKLSKQIVVMSLPGKLPRKFILVVLNPTIRHEEID